MAQVIQLKRGLKADLPILNDGEPGFCKDTFELYIGKDGVNVLPVVQLSQISTYIYTQIVPAQVWTIVHNLGRYPPVSVVDSAGTVVTGDITYISNQEVRLNFLAGFSGKAYLN